MTEQAEAATFLESLLGKTLQITIPDGRMFTGTFKCTDNEANVILSNAFEYRMPSTSIQTKSIERTMSSGVSVKADMTSRFVGLIVIPGKLLSRLEVEERRTPMPFREKYSAG